MTIVVGQYVVQKEMRMPTTFALPDNSVYSHPPGNATISFAVTVV
jgi:hypothetical protein